MGGDDDPVTALIDPLGVPRYEISCLLGFQWCRQRPEYLVEWKGYNVSYNLWVYRDSLMADVPGLVAAYVKNPTVFQAPPSAPKRATAGRQLLQPPLGAPPPSEVVAPPFGMVVPPRGRLCAPAAVPAVVGVRSSSCAGSCSVAFRSLGTTGALSVCVWLCLC